MPDFFDRYENRPVKSRELSLFKELKGIISVARSRAPSLRRQLNGIDIREIKKRSDLARIPVLRRADLRDLQVEQPPFGGLSGSRLSSLKRLHVSPGPWFQPEGQARDYWGAARALFAAGARKGDVILNCLSYHLCPEGHMMDSGAQSLGCAIVPAGDHLIPETLEAIKQLQPNVICARADYVDRLFAAALAKSQDISYLRRALIVGEMMAANQRRAFEQKGLSVRHVYSLPEVGVIAYETQADEGEQSEGFMLNEGIILEIVRPGGHEPLALGETGEMVITRLNVDYPLLRFGTGDLSRIVTGSSACGRTNLRIAGILGKV